MRCLSNETAPPPVVIFAVIKISTSIPVLFATVAISCVVAVVPLDVSA